MTLFSDFPSGVSPSGGGATRPLSRDGDVEELHGDPTEVSPGRYGVCFVCLFSLCGDFYLFMLYVVMHDTMPTSNGMIDGLIIYEHTIAAILLYYQKTVFSDILQVSAWEASVKGSKPIKTSVDDLLEQFRNLSFFDRHMVTSNTCKALLSLISSIISGR